MQGMWVCPAGCIAGTCELQGGCCCRARPQCSSHRLLHVQVVPAGAGEDGARDLMQEGGTGEERAGGGAPAPAAAPAAAPALRGGYLRVGSLPTALTCALYGEHLVRLWWAVAACLRVRVGPCCPQRYLRPIRQAPGRHSLMGCCCSHSRASVRGSGKSSSEQELQG